MKKLNFGCGSDIREGFDNVDIQKNEKIIKSFDFDKFPYPIKDNTYDYVLWSNNIEHLDKPKLALKELHRICKPNAIIEIKTAYFNNKSMTNDTEHKHYFSDATFINLVREPCVINKKKMFEIVELKLLPTKISKFMPESLRQKLSIFIGGIISDVRVKFKVVKENS